MFRVGQKVVCVDAYPGDARWPPLAEIIEGRVYTVRALGVTRLGRDGVKLE